MATLRAALAKLDLSDVAKRTIGIAEGEMRVAQRFWRGSIRRDPEYG